MGGDLRRNDPSPPQKLKVGKHLAKLRIKDQFNLQDVILPSSYETEQYRRMFPINCITVLKSLSHREEC